MTTKEWISANAHRFSTTSQMYDAFARENGLKRKTCIGAYCEMRPKPPLGGGYVSETDNLQPVTETKEPETFNSELAFVDEVQLMEKHNSFYIFETFLKSIPRGKFARETDVLRHLNMSGKPGYRQVVDHPDYKIYKGTADGIVYNGHPESIEKMKQKTTLK